MDRIDTRFLDCFADGSPDARDHAHLRELPNPRDESLSRVSRNWLLRLPEARRPKVTSAQYPRIVNRLALCWNDTELTERLFEVLLVDVRGQRRGFPAAVLSELLSLRELQPQRAPDAVAATSAAD